MSQNKSSLAHRHVLLTLHGIRYPDFIYYRTSASICRPPDPPFGSGFIGVVKYRTDKKRKKGIGKGWRQKRIGYMTYEINYGRKWKGCCLE
jgi:hypothetical protein